jgi:hypothetical protein
MRYFLEARAHDSIMFYSRAETEEDARRLAKEFIEHFKPVNLTEIALHDRVTGEVMARWVPHRIDDAVAADLRSHGIVTRPGS